MYQSIAINNNLANAITNINKKRIVKHLTYVVSKLESKNVSNLSIDMQEKRQKTIGLLKEYIELEEFPINETSYRRHAIFRDKYGNYCAVGYLMHMYGRDDLVNEIVTSNNLVYINEIEDQRYLSAITEIGITKDEAAMIQPGYGFDPYYPSTSSGSDKELLISTLAIVFYTLFQLTAFLLVKRIDKPRATKVLLYLTLFSGSSLVAVGIYAAIQYL